MIAPLGRRTAAVRTKQRGGKHAGAADPKSAQWRRRLRPRRDAHWAGSARLWEKENTDSFIFRDRRVRSTSVETPRSSASRTANPSPSSSSARTLVASPGPSSTVASTARVSPRYVPNRPPPRPEHVHTRFGRTNTNNQTPFLHVGMAARLSNVRGPARRVGS